MRIECPNCMAQYEVPQDALPQTGRDVQCSSCDHSWFQKHPGLVETTPPAARKTPKAPDGPAATDDTGGPSAAEATDQPARRSLDPAVADILQEEAAFEAKARAKEAAPLETQTDLGLAQTAPAQPEKPAAPMSDSLPDVDALTATLDPVAAPARGFRAGFWLMLSLCAGVAVVYVYAAQISQAAPAVKPLLETFSSVIDQLRLWLWDQVQNSTT